MIPLSSIKKKSKIVYRQSKPYQALGLIYDRIMQHVEYDGWARYIKRINNYEYHHRTNNINHPILCRYKVGHKS